MTIAEILPALPRYSPCTIAAAYTDSQARRDESQELSQTRAECRLTACASAASPSRPSPPSAMVKADPFADNDTADGAEANRRIAFS